MKPEKKPARPKSKKAEKKPTPAAVQSSGTQKEPGASGAAAKKSTPAKASPAPAPAAKAKEPEKPAQVKEEEKKAAPAAKAKKPLKVPAILLEGDASPAPKAGGPGARYALSSEAPSGHAPTAGELPESYGTGKLFLAARDPHWLYASWDLSREDQKKHNAQSRDGHLVLRVFTENESETVVPDVHVHPESRNWFIHVPHAETRYRAVLGYYDRASDWNELARSRGTLTPPEAPSAETEAEFATIPRHISFQALQEAVQEFITEKLPLVQSLLRGAPEPLAQDHARGETRKPWPLAKAAEIAKMVTIDNLRRVWMGSLEITELIRRRLQEEVSSMAAAELARGEGFLPGESVSSISSPFGAEGGRERKFWFNVNAELIIYGATEADAKVTIAGREVKLRPDGSFSFRFSLPDGGYDLPTVAVSGDGEETREAKLHFRRSSEYSGRVEAHPQDPALKPPRGENL